MIYLADFRYDEGLRIRKELISPTLIKLSRWTFVIEVSNENQKRNKTGLHNRETGGG